MKILVVDDAFDMRIVIRKTLTMMGYDVTVAEDGAQAWELLQKEVFQIVVSDWVMPVMDGPTLCRQIREANFPYYTYIILLTGMSGKKNLIQGMDAGADDFATKPVDQQELAVRLRAAERVLDLEQSLEEKNRNLAVVNQSLEEAQEHIRQDLHHAAILQQGMLPTTRALGPLRMEWLFRPAQFIGGDTFNYYPLSQDLYLFYTADVSGHGIPAALLSMYLNNLLGSSNEDFNQRCTGECTADRTEKLPGFLEQLAGRFNTQLAEKLDIGNNYFTMLLGIIDTERNKLHFVQAGHPKPYLIDAQQQLQLIDQTGFPVGLLPGAEFEATTIDFYPGSRFVAFSDGILEAKDTAGHLITEEHLEKMLCDIAAAPIDKAADELRSLCLADYVDEEQPDDISLLMIDFVGEPS